MHAQYIDRFIHFHATEKVIERGKRLYEKEKSKLIDLDEKADIANFLVEGGNIYRVRIVNFGKRNITTSCTCPYDWNILCKHTVASLLLLSDILENPIIDPTPIPPIKKRLNGSIPIQIPDWRYLNKSSLGINDHSLRRTSFIPINKPPQIIEASENHLILEVNIPHYYNYEKDLIHFYLKDEEVFCFSNAKYDRLDHFSSAEIHCLISLINSHNEELLKYFFDGTFLQKKKILKDKYDLSEEDVFNDYFKIFLEGTTVYYILHEKGEGLISPKANDYYLKGIRQLGLPYKQTPIESKTLRQIGFSLGITDSYHDQKEISIVTIKGQPNKSNTHLATHINYYKRSESKRSLSSNRNTTKNNKPHR